jgi:DNA-binding transcriptional LysR family regulator
MEIFELRYFLGVARFENIHKASEALKISPGSLSKAVSRLEDELSIKLFYREGRNIRLTDQGRVLQRRASELTQLEETVKIELAGQKGAIRATIAGPEVLLCKMGVELTARIKKKFPFSNFEFLATDDDSAIEQVEKGNAHLAITTNESIPKSGFRTEILAEAKFQTFVGVSHPLYSTAKSKKSIAVEEVLKYSFVSPTNPLLGQVGLKQSLDGWRDDHFPRKVEYLTSSLKLLEELVVTGKAIGYLPDYFCETLPITMLKVSGCPYSCVQKVKLVSRSSGSIGWLNQLL